jgi:hypothetical protein
MVPEMPAVRHINDGHDITIRRSRRANTELLVSPIRLPGCLGKGVQYLQMQLRQTPTALAGAYSMHCVPALYVRCSPCFFHHQGQAPLCGSVVDAHAERREEGDEVP